MSTKSQTRDASPKRKIKDNGKKKKIPNNPQLKKIKFEPRAPTKPGKNGMSVVKTEPEQKPQGMKIKKEPASRPAKKQSRSPSPDESPDTYSWKVMSERRNRFLGRPAFLKDGKVVFDLKKPHFPRMDGANYGDFQKREKLYLKRFSDAGEERTVSKVDLSMFNIFEDIVWQLNEDGLDEEINHWANPEDDDDYDPTLHQSIPTMISKLVNMEGRMKEGYWSFTFEALPERNEISLKRIEITIPSSKIINE